MKEESLLLLSDLQKLINQVVLIDYTIIILGGTSVVYKYSDELGTKYLIHEVTDARGYIIHRDFDAVRISSGQLINKGH